MRTGIISGLALLVCAAAGPAFAADKPVVKYKMIVVPIKPGTEVQNLGEGALIKTPGQPAARVQPHGRGVIVKQPGKPDVVCSPLGSRTVCTWT